MRNPAPTYRFTTAPVFVALALAHTLPTNGTGPVVAHVAYGVTTAALAVAWLARWRYWSIVVAAIGTMPSIVVRWLQIRALPPDDQIYAIVAMVSVCWLVIACLHSAVRRRTSETRR